MKNLLILSVIATFALTSCTVENSVLPAEKTQALAQLQDGQHLIQSNRPDECDVLVTYKLDNSSPCGYYLVWEEKEIDFVPKSLDLFEGFRNDGVPLLVSLGEHTFEEGYCDEKPGIEVYCVSLDARDPANWVKYQASDR